MFFLNGECKYPLLGLGPCVFKGLPAHPSGFSPDFCRNLRVLLRVISGKVTRAGGKEGRTRDELIFIPVEKPNGNSWFLASGESTEESCSCLVMGKTLIN